MIVFHIKGNLFTYKQASESKFKTSRQSLQQKSWLSAIVESELKHQSK